MKAQFVTIATFLSLTAVANAGGGASPKNCTIDQNTLNLSSLVNKYIPNGVNGRGSAAAIYKVNGKGEIVQNLFEKNAHIAQAVASTQKVLTAFVALKYGKLQTQTTFSNLDLDFDEEGTRAIYRSTSRQVQVGDSVKTSDLLYTLLMQSSNGAAQTLSRSLASHSSRDFMDLVNQEVSKVLGTPHQTFFQNPHGLTDSSSKYRFSSEPQKRQQSTASEMARLFGHIMGQGFVRDGLSQAGLSGARNGDLAKPGYTRAAGKTYIMRFALPKSPCGDHAISMAFFGDDTENQFARLRELMTQVREDILNSVGTKATTVKAFTFADDGEER